MDIKPSFVGWFEISVLDMDRAIRFYQAVFDLELSRNRSGPLDMAWFPWVEKSMGAAGSLVRSEPALWTGLFLSKIRG